MEIRRASWAELSDAVLLVNEYYEAVGVIERDGDEALRGYLTGEGSAFWIAYEGETPAGCVLSRQLPQVDAAVECKRLYVRPEFRKRGVAEKLMSALEEHARQAKSEWVYLDSKDDLQAARQLYQRLGYESCDRYNRNVQATIFLRKRLR